MSNFFIYKNHLVEKSFPSGYYTVLIPDYGKLTAETRQDIKEMIRQAEKQIKTGII